LTSQASLRPHYDAVVIGAGICGIYQAYKLSQMGLRSIVLEKGSGPGGTWHWNRYPGCRFDSESETYGYSWSAELLAEWDWTEHFAPREETERYLQYVVKKFDLEAMMQFGCEVSAAHWQEDSRMWTLRLTNGRTLTTRFLLTAIGLLSAPTMPRYEGVNDFQGLSFHTYYAPKDPIDWQGKRVAVIGTGATGVQLISAIAKNVEKLSVYQRRPNWCAPLNNSPISAEEMNRIKGRYAEIFERCRSTPSGFVHDVDSRTTFEVTDKQRNDFWEQLYHSPGFGIWLGNFKDMLVDPAANAEFSNFVARKIRQRVQDPALADKLIPKDHGFGTRRVPMETKYYEVFNQDNVKLIDLEDTPIVCITKNGIRTTQEEELFDIIVYATGFDAVTGAFERMDVVGANGLTLKDKWRDGPVTGYGMAISGFPNLLTLAGPQSGSVATNFPRGIEEAVDWCTGLLQAALDKGVTRFELKPNVEVYWGQHVMEMAEKILFTKERSWFTGYNSNVNREYVKRYLIYAGGAQRFRDHLYNETSNGFPGFDFKRSSGPKKEEGISAVI
jgi:cation diffusion facilitator CzcD-associated flavoprotein CzcO